MSRRENREAKSKPLIKILIVIAIIIIAIIVGLEIYNGILNARPENTNLVINNNNVTERLKNAVIIDNDVVYVSKEDVKNFFDRYIYQDESTKKLITTYEKKIAALELDSKTVEINGSEKQINATLKQENNTIYLPMTELSDVYNVEIEYKEGTNIVTMDSLDKGQTKAYAAKDISIKEKPAFFTRGLETVKKGNWLIYATDVDNGYAKVRTQNGKVGYVKKNDLANFDTVRQAMKQEKQIEGKVNMAWDYFYENKQAPDRKGTKIDGVNVVSPSFFTINSKGEFYENVGTKGEAYIEWAKSNGYKVWPMIASNSNDGIDVRSEILNSFDKRQKLIDTIVDECVKYKLDGVNLDFEYMYEKDKDAFSRFIIELEPRMKEIGAVLTVDVTAPDGAPTWSLCFDRNVIGDVADYIIFMAYDQNSGKKVGTGAGYNWVETNLKKFIETEEIKPEKIVLAFAFYSRLWTEKGEDVSSSIVNIPDINKVIPSNVERQWNDTLKQDYVEYTEKNAAKKMWIEDEKSIKEKLNLVSQYKLGGVSSWEIDRASNDIWGILKEALN